MTQLARRAVAALLISLAAVAQGQAQNGASERRVAADVAFLASDSLAGRFTGSAGAREASAHIAEAFRRAGLRPGVNGSWFQEFRVSPNAPALHGTGLGGDSGLAGRNGLRAGGTRSSPRKIAQVRAPRAS
jgi:hypothetical protein